MTMYAKVNISSQIAGQTRRAMTAAAAMFLFGCAVGPDYKTPEIPTGPGWTPIDGVTTDAVESNWWQRFDDPKLTSLIDSAQKQSLAIAEAKARVTEARAIRAAAIGGFWPGIAASGSSVRQRSSENVPGLASLGGGSAYQTVYDVGLDSAWELDLFGKTRRRVESADAAYHSAIERERDVRTSIIAETTLTYFELRGAQLQLVAEQASYAAAGKNHALIERRYQVGRASLADLHRAYADFKSIDARIPGLEALRDVAARRLSLLLGELPESRIALTSQSSRFPILAPVPIGTRADLVRRRPDVRASERALAAATANIGVAKGEFFPSLSLVSSAGYSSSSSGSLTDSVSRTWSVMPLIQWRLFEGGRIKAEVKAAKSRAKQAALAYEASVLGAISEVEQSLIRYHRQLDAVDRQAAAVKATEAGLELIDRQYRAGGVSLLILLDAQRQLNSARSQLAQFQTNAALDLVRLYRALGGGW